MTRIRPILLAAVPEPSPAGVNGEGRDPQSGQFLRGNKLARGNRHQERITRLRTALLDAVTPGDMRKVIKRLVTKAKAGDMQAAKLLLDRLYGRAPQAIQLLVHDEHDDFDPSDRFL